MKKQPNTIAEYIAMFPENIREILTEMKQVIEESAPQAEETISYGIPTFKLNGNLVHFAAYKKHVGFYPTSSGIKAFKKELSPYRLAKGTVQFPIDKPIPFGIVKKIVAYRVRENLAKPKGRPKITGLDN
jgi:uncharacterized protein YdhG (YjbR/CyaY superfamily)